MFFAVILVIGAIASAAYSYFRLNKRRVGFQHFEVRQRKTGTWWWGVLSETQPLALAGLCCGPFCAPTPNRPEGNSGAVSGL